MTQRRNERPVHFRRVLAKAKKTFGDQQAALSWLQTPRRRFQGRTPMEMLNTEADALKVEELLIQIDEGMFL